MTPAGLWAELDRVRKRALPLTVATRSLAHQALDRLLDVDPHLTLWLLTRSRVAVEDTLDAGERR